MPTLHIGSEFAAPQQALPSPAALRATSKSSPFAATGMFFRSSYCLIITRLFCLVKQILYILNKYFFGINPFLSQLDAICVILPNDVGFYLKAHLLRK